MAAREMTLGIATQARKEKEVVVVVEEEELG